MVRGLGGPRARQPPLAQQIALTLTRSFCLELAQNRDQVILHRDSRSALKTQSRCRTMAATITVIHALAELMQRKATIELHGGGRGSPGAAW